MKRNNDEKARSHERSSRASTAGCWFSGSVNAVAPRRQCTIEIARCIYKWHPFRKGKRRRNTRGAQRFYRSARIRVDHAWNVAGCPRRSTDRSNRRAFFLLSLFFEFAFSISIPDNRYYLAYRSEINCFVRNSR